MLLASCAQDQESSGKSMQITEANWDSDGVAFAEFLMCTKGPDFSRANLEEMSDAFGQLALSEDLMWSGGYAPVEDPVDNPGGLYWENNWTSEAAAKTAWEGWSTNEEARAWSDKYSNVFVCDETQAFRYEGYFQAPESSSLKDWDSFVAAEISCEYNEGKSFVDLERIALTFGGITGKLILMQCKGEMIIGGRRERRCKRSLMRQLPALSPHLITEWNSIEQLSLVKLG